MAGPKILNDRQWRNLTDKIARASGAAVHVGVLASGKGNQAVPGARGLDMIGLATVHELGSRAAGIPERSFIRSTFEKGAPEIGKMTARLATAFVTGKMSLHKALDVLGHKGAAMVKANITQGPHIPPPLKPATIAAKGSDRPLVDTGRLVDSVTHEVVNAGERGTGGYRR